MDQTDAGCPLDPLRFCLGAVTHFHPIYQGKSGMSGERVAGK